MTIEIVVDANVIISALIGGSSRDILYDHRYEFLTTKFTLKEVKKYIPEIAEKSGTDKEFVMETLELIPLTIKERDFYEESVGEAEEIDVFREKIQYKYNDELTKLDFHDLGKGQRSVATILAAVNKPCTSRYGKIMFVDEMDE